MLTNPRPGSRVQLWYGPRYLPHVRPGLHGACGVVVVVGKGRPRNHSVRLDSGETVVVPSGNLRLPVKHKGSVCQIAQVAVLPTTHEQQPALLLTEGQNVGDKSSTPLLDALQAGPWPVLVEELKAEAKKRLEPRP